MIHLSIAPQIWLQPWQMMFLSLPFLAIGMLPIVTDWIKPDIYNRSLDGYSRSLCFVSYSSLEENVLKNKNNKAKIKRFFFPEWWHKPVIPAHGMLRQENQESEINWTTYQNLSQELKWKQNPATPVNFLIIKVGIKMIVSFCEYFEDFLGGRFSNFFK